MRSSLCTTTCVPYPFSEIPESPGSKIQGNQSRASSRERANSRRTTHDNGYHSEYRVPFSKS